MKSTLLLSTATVLVCSMLVSCQGPGPGYDPSQMPPGEVPPPPGQVTEVHHHHYYRPSDSTTKSASVGGGSGGSAEGFQAVTPPHSYSQ